MLWVINPANKEGDANTVILEQLSVYWHKEVRNRLYNTTHSNYFGTITYFNELTVVLVSEVNIYMCELFI